MMSQNAFQLSVYGLFFTLTIFGQAMGNPLPDPEKVDCQYVRWSQWTTCDSCHNQRSRTRGITAFGQFGGQRCAGSLGEKGACSAQEACVNPPAPNCSISEFQCESGTCIKKNLECNYDIDCEDQSDEDCEGPPRKPCRSRELDTNRHGRSAGYGINILGSSPLQNPFYNEYFHGFCSQMWDPTQQAQIRLPWNVAVLNYETNVEETATNEVYSNSDSLVNEVLKENSHSIDGGLSFKFGTGLESAGGGIEAGHETSDIVREVRGTTTTKSQRFVRVKGRVQLASFRMRPRSLRVADQFLNEVRFLPLQYEKKAYFDFMEMYGTHYTRYGKFGGEYQLVYVLNNEVITKKDVNEETLKNCLTVGAKLEAADIVSANIKNKDCDSVTTKKEGDNTQEAMVDMVHVFVRGGDIAATAAMKTTVQKDGTMDADVYRQWAQSIINNPALIHSEPEPIYTVIPLDMPDASTRVAHLKRAIADYVAEYNMCKCQPCQNGGTVALVDGLCLCLCPHMFDGLACQNFKPEGAHINLPRPRVAQLGNWGCWSPWSACLHDRHRLRSRTCTEGLHGAGCSGSAQGREEC
ncbi:complement component C9 isoform X2 [Gadus macrocephalus]|uniref:complement component C9 isoform X2 n=1 Tax=Gadus macrocephalus TaxID=80720 RepID=UPI0028CBBA2A|nr:complement component C9 isoform X2 [Gadus macrocephalus]